MTHAHGPIFSEAHFAAPPMAMTGPAETITIAFIWICPRAMLETCGSAGKGASEGGCTFPVTES